MSANEASGSRFSVRNMLRTVWPLELYRDGFRLLGGSMAISLQLTALSLFIEVVYQLVVSGMPYLTHDVADLFL